MNLLAIMVVGVAAGDDSSPPKYTCPGIAPEVLAHIIEFADKEFVGGSTYGSVLRAVRKWARDRQPPVEFSHEQQKCWVKHVKDIYETKLKQAEVEREENRVDFRKARWGMTKAQVRATEPGSPYLEQDGNLLYLAEMYSIPASIAYMFTNGILTMAGLEFPDAQKNVDAVAQALRTIEEHATREAGKPIEKDVDGDAIYTV